MIKGINRQVVEVNDTECEYFEKILFFVKPEYSNVTESKLRERAGKIIASTGAPPRSRGKRNFLGAVAKLGAAAGAGAAITAFISSVW